MDLHKLSYTFLHDIKNKLANMKFSVSLLLKKNLPKEQENKILTNILLSIEKSIEIIYEFLEIEKYKSLKYLPAEKFILKELINEILNEFMLEIREKKLTTELIGEDIYIIHNKEWLKKALTNLIHNAIKYNIENGNLYIYIKSVNNNFQLIIENSTYKLKKSDIETILEDKNYSSNIGLSLSKTIIESFNGKMFIKDNRKYSVIIVLPKISKRVKIKRLITSMSLGIAFAIFGIISYFPLIPQIVKKEEFNNIKNIYFENGVVINANKNSNIKYKAYKNLFSSKFKTEIKILKGDVKISSAHNKLKVFLKNTLISNLGTEFESVVNKYSAISVFDGKIKSKNLIISSNEGLIIKNKLTKTALPKKPFNIKISSNKIIWDGYYKQYKIVIAKDKNLHNIIISNITSSKSFDLPLLVDTKLYVGVFSIKDNLFSLPEKNEFINLQNYQKGYKYYLKQNIPLAKFYLEKSISTIKNYSAKPYILYGKILLKTDHKKALKFIKKGYEINNSYLKEYIKALFLNSKYKKIINFKNKLSIKEKEYILIIKSLVYLKRYKEAKSLLWTYLNFYPSNKEALKLLKNLTNNSFIKRNIND